MRVVLPFLALVAVAAGLYFWLRPPESTPNPPVPDRPGNGFGETTRKGSGTKKVGPEPSQFAMLPSTEEVMTEFALEAGLTEKEKEDLIAAIEELDKNPAKNRDVHIHTIENADVDEVAEILRAMFESQSGGGRSTGNNSSRNTGQTQRFNIQRNSNTGGGGGGGGSRF